MADVKLEVDRGRCMGAGECVYSAPEAFGFDDDGKAVVLKPELDTKEAIELAVNGCPNFAIRATWPAKS